MLNDTNYLCRRCNPDTKYKILSEFSGQLAYNLVCNFVEKEYFSVDKSDIHAKSIDHTAVIL